MNKENNLKKETKEDFEIINIVYKELDVVIGHQNNLSIKVSVLIALQAIVISLTITLSIKYNLYYLCFLLWILTATFFNCLSLFPFFAKKPSDENIVYFKNMENIENKKLLNELKNKERILNELKTNSKITKEKYLFFNISLLITFCFFIPFWYFLKVFKKSKKI